MLNAAGSLSRVPGTAQSAPARPAALPAARPRHGPAPARAARRAAADPSVDRDASDLVNLARRRMAEGRPSSSGAASASGGGGASGKVVVDPNADLITKLKAAWRIFFPEALRPLSPKEEGKKRLRMILVADRCGMSADSLSGMRESIVRAMAAYVEVEAEEAVEVNLSMDPEIGTIYSVAVPVRRVKPALRPAMAEGGGGGGGGGAAGAWDPNDPDSDPSDQFPWGT